jgi:hypothetical protein
MCDNNPSSVNGWVKLYHPCGVQVTLPIPSQNPITPEMAAGMLASVGSLVSAGWLPNLPNLEDGEQEHEIGAVLRCVQINDDESETPIIDLFPANERLKYKVLRVYLNTAEDVKAFEKTCGVNLADLPLYESNAGIKRGENARLDQKYIIPLKHPVKVVSKANPLWEGEEDKKHLKRLLTRWGLPASHPLPALPEPQTETTSVVGDDNGNPETSALCAICRVTLPKHDPQCAQFQEQVGRREYGDGGRVNGNPSERTAYDAYIKAHNQLPTNIQALRDWIGEQPKEPAPAK